MKIKSKTIILFFIFNLINPAYAKYLERNIVSDNLNRTFRIYIPQNFEASEHLPLIIVLHGGGSWGKRMSNYIKINSLADKERFVAVFPDGVKGNWNDGRKNINSYAHTHNINDVAFISGLITYLEKDLNINSGSVFVTGISNGSLMTFRLACEIPQKIRAIATVAGNLPRELQKCNPEKKIPVLLINGERDPIMPWNGGGVGWGFQKRGNVLSVEETFSFWINQNGCKLPKRYIEEPDKANDGTKVFKQTGLNCQNNNEVVIYKIQNGGHSWPGAFEYAFQENFVGKTSYDIDANEVIWSFFKKYSN
jgi:polyhydroxybutyrate depolymerase